MDILIKGLEMPKSCGNCKFSQFHEANPWTTWYTCLFSNKDIDDTGNGRLVGCPLIPVPEHGDLIDRQKFYEKIVQHIKDTESEDFTDKEREMVQMAMKAVLYELLNECAVVLERTT